MKFTFLNMSFVVSYGDKQLVFPLKPIINKRNIETHNQTTLLNHYLKYKGDSYCSMLWEKLSVAHAAIERSGRVNKLEYLQEIHDVIDAINLMDISTYIKDVYQLIPPSDLLDTFSDKEKTEGKIYQDQTFLKSEYLDLAALVVALKIIVGPITYFLFTKSALCSDKLEYDGFKYIKNSHLYHSPPMEKVHGMVKRLIKTTSSLDIFLIEKKIAESEVSVYILSIIAIQRIATAVLINDANNDHKHIITVLYGYGNSKLNPSGDVSRVIRDNKVVPTGNGEENAGSVVENNKAISDLTKGNVVEYNNANRSIEIIYQNGNNFVKKYLDIEEAKLIRNKLSLFKEIDIPEETDIMVAIILKSVNTPFARKHLEMEVFLNRLACSYVILKNMGLEKLATIITSIRVEASFAGRSINKVRLSADVKKEIALYTPSRKINSSTNLNVSEDWIGDMASAYFESTWHSIIDEVPNNEVIVSDLKMLLANLLIRLEKES